MISSAGLRRNHPRTILLSKFSSTSSFNMLPALLYGQADDRANLEGQTSLGSWHEYLVLVSVAVVGKYLLLVGA